MSPSPDLLFYAVATGAVLLQGISKAGFGGAIGTLAVPLFALVAAPQQAAAILLPILLAMDVLGLIAFRGRVDFAVLRIAVPSALLGVLLGWALYSWLDADWMRLLIGIEAILFGWATLRAGSRAWTGPRLPLRTRPAVLWSAASGLTSFVAHAGGPPMMQLLMPLRMPQQLLVGTMVWHFAFLNVSKIGPYASLGLLDGANLGISLMLLPAVPVGYFIGLWFLKRASPAVFVRMTAVAMLLTGVRLVWDGST